MKKRQLQAIYLENVEHCRFCGVNGEAEHFLAITAPGNLSFKEQVEYIEASYEAKIQALGLTMQTAVFRRIFLSDVFNQLETVKKSQLACDCDGHPVAVSIIQQPPLPYAKIAFLAYHIESKKPLVSQRLSPSQVLIRKNSLGYLWSTNICAQDTEKSLSIGAQTQSIFVDLINGLSIAGGDLYENCIRTWIYVSGIYIFYPSLVVKRQELFEQQGLRDNTHFIASTGIAGTGPYPHDLVTMDAYSILGLKPGQVSYLNDFDMLCPPNKYKVTFERCTRVIYADRSHYFISGTASIDKLGKVLYPGNILKQLERTLDNISSLLHAGKASFDDLMYMIVYLRDPSDFGCVKVKLRKRFPLVPIVFVHAEVCRREWVVEIEGVAIKREKHSSYPLF